METFSVYQEWNRIRSNASTVHPLKTIPQIMCAPGSTATVEGIFSVAGYILSPRRMSFTDLKDECLSRTSYLPIRIGVFSKCPRINESCARFVRYRVGLGGTGEIYSTGTGTGEVFRKWELEWGFRLLYRARSGHY